MHHTSPSAGTSETGWWWRYSLSEEERNQIVNSRPRVSNGNLSLNIVQHDVNRLCVDCDKEEIAVAIRGGCIDARK